MESIMRMWKLEGKTMKCISFTVDTKENKGRKRLIKELESSGYTTSRPKGTVAVICHEKMVFGGME